MNKRYNLQIKARDALWFLDFHPAICEDVWGQISFSIVKVCKHGYDEIVKHGVDIRKSSKFAEKYKDKLDAEIKKFKKEYPKAFDSEGLFVSIRVPYKELFGEAWKFDHVEYWGSIPFKVFTGDLKDKLAWRGIEGWTNYEGFSVHERTFEEMVIKLAQKFKKAFGDFCSEDFLTKEEKSNHNYVEVNRADLNRRWLKWFAGMDYCKKHWENSFDKLLAGSK